jgi:hypothetical protein
MACSSKQRGTSRDLIGCFEDKMSAFFYVQAQGSRFDSSFSDGTYDRPSVSDDQS